MYCPKCKSHLRQVATFYPTPPGRVYECFKCQERFTYVELEDWPVCTACEEVVQNTDDSLCKSCKEKLC